MSYYEPKKVFVKTENGAYTEITYQQFKTLRETDETFRKRKFVRVYVDTLVEFDEEGNKKMDSYRRHLRHLRRMDIRHKLSCYGCIHKPDREQIDPILQIENTDLIEKLRNCLARLDQVDKIIITGLYFENMKQKDIAEIIGMTQSGVSKRLKKILTKLKAELMG